MSMKKYVLSAVVFLLILCFGASATLVDTTVSYSGAQAINTLYPDKVLEVGPSGNVTFDNRVDMTGTTTACQIIMNGGILNISLGNPGTGLEMPPAAGGGATRVYVNAGTMTCSRIQNWGDERDARIYIGGGTLIVQQYYHSGYSKFDAALWILDGSLVALPGYKMNLTDLGAGTVKIEGQSVPGPVLDKPFGGYKTSDHWPLLWLDGTEGPFDSYDVYLGTDQSAVADANNTRGPCPGAGSFLGDIDGDCLVNSTDLMYLAAQWLGAPSLPSADVVNNDNFVNLLDFGAVSGDWLGSNPFQGNQTAKRFNLKDRLVPGKTYYWRVDGHKGGDIIASEVRSFVALPRWKPDKFLNFIGWASLYNSSDSWGYIQLLSDLGINTVMETAGIAGFLNDAHNDAGYNIRNMVYDHPTWPSTAAAAENDWTTFGYFQGSEPSVSTMQYWANYHWNCHWAAPLKPCWTDVQSINYGVSRSYIEDFITMFNPELMTFDYYEWYWSQTLIENLEYFRKKTLENDIPLYSWVEVDASTTKATNLTRIRRSVYLNLMYGVKGISWFTASKIFNTAAGTISNQARYDVVQEVNVEINNLGPELLDLTSTAVYHTGIGTVTKDWTGGTDPMVAIPGGHWVQIAETGFGLGMFQNQDGDDYAMVVNRVYSTNGAYRTATVTFKTQVTQVEAFDAVAGTWSALTISGTTPNQQVSLSLIAGGGKLLRITHAAP